MSTAADVDIALDAGADFGLQIYWVDAQQSPFTVLSPMRMDIMDEVGNIVQSLQTDDDDPSNPTILYNSESGLIQLMLTADQTALMVPGLYDYDLFVTYMDNAVTLATRLKKLLTGTILVNGRVTKVV
jgi:hypothetical protein